MSSLATSATLITGASAGIGLQTAYCLASKSAQPIIITGRDVDRLESVARELSLASECKVFPITCDHSQKASIEQLFEKLAALPFPVFNVIANVGENPVHQHGPSKTHNTAYDVFSQILTTNLIHTFYLVSHLLQTMRQQRYGKIVLIGSQAHKHGIPGQVSYNVSKSGLSGLKNTVVSEYASANIFCHLLEPGLVLNARTERMRKRLPLLAEQQGVTEEQVAHTIVELLSIEDLALNGQEVSL